MRNQSTEPRHGPEMCTDTCWVQRWAPGNKINTHIDYWGLTALSWLLRMPELTKPKQVWMFVMYILQQLFCFKHLGDRHKLRNWYAHSLRTREVQYHGHPPPVPRVFVVVSTYLVDEPYLRNNSRNRTYSFVTTSPVAEDHSLWLVD